MIYKHALAYLNAAPATTDAPGLAVLPSLLRELGHSMTKGRTVSVTGSHFLGDTARLIAAMLRQAGFSVGLLLPPMGEDLRASLLLNGSPISSQELTRHTDRVANALLTLRLSEDTGTRKSIKLPPLPFSTADALGVVALSYFTEQGVDFAVMAGRDPHAMAALCPTPVCQVITPVADEPAGSARRHLSAATEGRHCEIVSTPQDTEPHKYLVSLCALAGNRLTIPARMGIEIAESRPAGLSFSYRSRRYTAPVCTERQLYPIVTAVECAYALRRSGVRLPGADMEAAIRALRTPDRPEIVSRCPTILMAAVDGEYPTDYLTEALPELSALVGDEPKILLPPEGISGGEALPKAFTLADTSYTTLRQILNETNENTPLLFLGSHDTLALLRRHVARFMDEK